MEIFVKNVKGLVLPKQAYTNDVGADVVSASEPIIKGEFFETASMGKLWKHISYIEYKTSLFISPIPEWNKNYYVELWPRSSICGYNLFLGNSLGLVDPHYTGELLFRFRYLTQPEDLYMLPEFGINKFYTRINWDKIYKLGDKIGQIVVRKTAGGVNFKVVNELPVTERNSGGFGSSGK